MGGTVGRLNGLRAKIAAYRALKQRRSLTAKEQAALAKLVVDFTALVGLLRNAEASYQKFADAVEANNGPG